MERCVVVIENINKCKIYIFFVVTGDGDTLLGMPDIDLSNILQIKCNTIHTKKEKKGTNYNQNKNNAINVESEQFCTNTGPERDCDKKDKDVNS